MLKLELLKGREKFKYDFDRCVPPIEISELRDGDRTCPGTKGETGELAETPLLPESFRGNENVDPAFELV